MWPGRGEGGAAGCGIDTGDATHETERAGCISVTLRVSVPRGGRFNGDEEAAGSAAGRFWDVHTALRICLIQNRNNRVNLTTKARFLRNGVPRSDVSRWSL